jgi:hypothetical protein
MHMPQWCHFQMASSGNLDHQTWDLKHIYVHTDIGVNRDRGRDAGAVVCVPDLSIQQHAPLSVCHRPQKCAIDGEYVGQGLELFIASETAISPYSRFTYTT